MREILSALVLTGLVGYLDWTTGTELRVFPLYFVPVGTVAWRSGAGAGIILSVFAISAWEVSSLLGGASYASLFVQVWNVTVQWGALAAFALLLARLRGLVDAERAASRMDALTRVANSREFHDVLGRALDRGVRPLALAYVDLDHFKSVNDQYGHRRGDEVLVLFAQLVRAECRATDCVARLGGDEFALLLPGTGLDGARALLERVRRRVREEMAARALPVTASIGAVVADTGTRPEELVRCADAVMYAVKRTGRDAIRVEPLDVAASVACGSGP